MLNRNRDYCIFRHVSRHILSHLKTSYHIGAIQWPTVNSVFHVNCLQEAWKRQEACLRQPSSCNYAIRSGSTFARSNTGKDTMFNSCLQEQSSPPQLAVLCQNGELTGFTISVTFTRFGTSCGANHCSHATHTSSCCSLFQAMKGACVECYRCMNYAKNDWQVSLYVCRTQKAD